MIGKLKCESQEVPIEERHPPFDPMRHQATVYLGHENVRKPIADVPSLEHVEVGEPPCVEAARPRTVVPLGDLRRPDELSVPGGVFGFMQDQSLWIAADPVYG
jgi:hypothetical protein